MRTGLLATALVVLPLSSFAQSHCAVPVPAPVAAESEIVIPAPVTVGGAAVPLMPTVAPQTALAGLRETAAAPTRPEPARDAMTTVEMKASPVVAHIAAARATVTDLGVSHGLRVVSARNGGQVIVFAVVPDGQAAVAGLMTDLSVAQLRAIGGKDLSELPSQHGLRTLFLRNGGQFQVFYASPDDERVIPGVMWDATGKDLTRDEVASIPGTIPTVTIGAGAASASAGSSAAPDVSLLAVAEGTTHGSIGRATAPELWMFVDPQCSFSVRAMQQLEPYVASGKVRLNVIPLSILDHEDDGLSTRTALNLVSASADQMVIDWKTGHAAVAPSSDAPSKLQANMAAAAAIHLQGTPTFLWRKIDGTVGRLDGIPSDISGLLASVRS